jgi:hypothetical protein
MKARATTLAVVFLASTGCRPADRDVAKSDSAVASSTSMLIGAPKRVDSLTLELPLQNGKSLTFRDNPVEGDNFVHYEYVGPVPGIGYHLIRRQYYESVQYLLVHPRTGITSVVPDSPAVSPDQKRVLVASMNFEDGESPNSLEVWQTTSDSLLLEFQVETGDAEAMTGWGPSNAHWINATTAAFTRNYPIKNTIEMRQSPGWLVLHPSGWGIQDQRP